MYKSRTFGIESRKEFVSVYLDIDFSVSGFENYWIIAFGFGSGMQTT
jgi:hypothetical protein